jgi:hypothetical protein
MVNEGESESYTKGKHAHEHSPIAPRKQNAKGKNTGIAGRKISLKIDPTF